MPPWNAQTTAAGLVKVVLAIIDEGRLATVPWSGRRRVPRATRTGRRGRRCLRSVVGVVIAGSSGGAKGSQEIRRLVGKHPCWIRQTRGSWLGVGDVQMTVIVGQDQVARLLAFHSHLGQPIMWQENRQRRPLDSFCFLPFFSSPALVPFRPAFFPTLS